ncbi:alpha/beta hydrolase family protein [Mycobacterium kyorinense]|uniref:Esterase n=1 Tax=Mycobacterium kyorinense TaxID=487514 RepID=A0A1X1Y4H4_9MYCO|nr:alpha/beta fold hydrolase [Mycobacterium kyorinense]ORW05920.1 esterase [Mycobacterium kyorinense]
MQTVEYAPGRLADLVGDADRRAVLIWHGQQSNARAAVRPLAELVAGHGLAVVAPDWNSHAADGGRDDLLRSVEFARQQAPDPDALVLVGWSLGGAAAAGLTAQASRHGLRFAHTVCLAGAFMVPDPITGKQPAAWLTDAQNRSPFTLLHGVADHAVPLQASRDFASALEQNGWPVELAELAADHGSIAGASYDPVADRYSAGRDRDTLAVAADVAARIAAAAGIEF